MMNLLPDLMVAVGSVLFTVGLLLLFGARREDVIDLREPPLELEPARYEPLAIEAKASSSSSRDE